MACSSGQPGGTADSTPFPANTAQNAGVSGGEEFYASDNFDLGAVGSLLEKANNAQEFEYLLNSDNRYNNLDLNGDGYADYISVAEYDDRDTNQRGFALFDRFGLNEIQEIARIILGRDSYGDRGARVLLVGNEQIYGDNFYYETDWRDRPLNIVRWAFSDRNDYYQSPYYYDNYPGNYQVYRVVGTPVYRTRIGQYYPQPVFIRTANPTITQIKIKSKYNYRSVNKVYARLAKPTKEQEEFRKNNPGKPDFAPDRKGADKESSSKPEAKPEKESKPADDPSKGKGEKPADQGKPGKTEKQNGQSSKPSDGGKKAGGKPGKN